MLFHDRQDAGRQLAERLEFLKGEPGLIVFGIPRGGVVVAAEVARALCAPLEVFVAHKIGAPSNPELAIGAVTSNGDVFLDEELIHWLKLPEHELSRAIDYQRREIARRLELFRKGLPSPEVKDKIAIVVDDGIATGSTMLAALRALRKQGPRKLILAVPVGPPETIVRLARDCDQVIALKTPEPFWAVGRFYAQFAQTDDAQVVELLEAARLAQDRP